MITIRPVLAVRVAAVVAAAGLSGALLVGCGNAAVPVPPASTPSATSPGAPSDPPADPPTGPTAPSADDPDRVEVDGRTLVVPPGFPFPADATIAESFPGTVIFTAPMPDAMLAFYRTALPEAGYEIGTDAGGLLTFEGHGWVGQLSTTSTRTVLGFGTAAEADEEPPAGPDDTMLTGVDLGITHLPRVFRFPAGTTIADLQDAPSGASLTITAPEPQALLAFYRELFVHVHFEITDDRTADGVTTIRFTATDWTGVLTVGPDKVEVTFVAPGTEDDPLLASDVGVTNVPFFLRFPAGTTLTDVTDVATGASFTFSTPDAATIIAFYRDRLEPHFEIVSDETTGGVTTITFATDEHDPDGWTGEITERDGTVTVALHKG